MVIPKQFETLKDLEAMLLTCILGTLVSLKEDLISIQQAESYWFNDFTADLFEQMSLSDEIIDLINECNNLAQLQAVSTVYYDKLDELISTSKELLFECYTEYDEQDLPEIQEIEIKSMMN